MSDHDYYLKISAPNRPGAFAQLLRSLDVGDEVVWNGRDEPCTVIEIEDEHASPDGLGRFEKRLVVKNQNRSNGGRFRLTYQGGTDGGPQFLGDGIDPQCSVQRHVGERGNREGWGRAEPIESLGHVNPVVSAADGGRDE